jgi:hypothetical protein
VVASKDSVRELVLLGDLFDQRLTRRWLDVAVEHAPGGALRHVRVRLSDGQGAQAGLEYMAMLPPGDGSWVVPLPEQIDLTIFGGSRLSSR